MHRQKSILLISILGMLLMPWSLLDFCITHPQGHEHAHKPGEPTPCELRRQYKGNEPFVSAPMDCYQLSIDADDFQIPNGFQVKPNFPTLIFIADLLDFYRSDYRNEPFPLPPVPRCRSTALISDFHLRGPPLV
jgi:hypothetical protein